VVECEAVVAVVCAEGTKRSVRGGNSAFLHVEFTLPAFRITLWGWIQILGSEWRLMISYQPRAEPWKAKVGGLDRCQLDSSLLGVLREHSCRVGNRGISQDPGLQQHFLDSQNRTCVPSAYDQDALQ
jgi:hypothetical protein